MHASGTWRFEATGLSTMPLPSCIIFTSMCMLVHVLAQCAQHQHKVHAHTQTWFAFMEAIWHTVFAFMKDRVCRAVSQWFFVTSMSLHHVSSLLKTAWHQQYAHKRASSWSRTAALAGARLASLLRMAVRWISSARYSNLFFSPTCLFFPHVFFLPLRLAGTSTHTHIHAHAQHPQHLVCYLCTNTIHIHVRLKTVCIFPRQSRIRHSVCCLRYSANL